MLPDPRDSEVSKDEADSELDISEEDSFPASDPPSITDPAKSIKNGEGSKPR